MRASVPLQVTHEKAKKETYKPIFHCEAKYLASWVGVGNATDARMLRWRYQHVGIFWRYLTPNLKFALSPTPTPDASQWNIGGGGPSGVGAGVGHVHFIFFVFISFAFGGQRKPSIQWNMGYRLPSFCKALKRRPKIKHPGLIHLHVNQDKVRK